MTLLFGTCSKTSAYFHIYRHPKGCAGYFSHPSMLSKTHKLNVFISVIDKVIFLIYNNFEFISNFDWLCIVNASIDLLTKKLTSRGIRPSYQRIKVLEYLYQKGGHPTVDKIFRALSPDIPSLSKVTIYNTLHTFVEAGLARVVDIDDTEMRYDITLSNHGHFLCKACGTIFNFEVNIDQIPIEGLNQFEITEKNIYFKGLCPNCLSQPSHNIKE